MMYIAGDTIDRVVPLGDGRLIVHDSGKGFMLYDKFLGENQITGEQWKQYAKAVTRELGLMHLEKDEK